MLVIIISTLLLFSSFAFAEELQEIEIVETIEEESFLSYKNVNKTNETLKKTNGETLGDYLNNQLGVEKASYSNAVGRPVVNGMDSYRVGISQGDISLNDLSAMSQDHALGLNAQISKQIELIKGPASLLYGSYSGGVIRVLGEEHIPSLAKKGVSGNILLQTNSVTKNGTASIKSSYATDTFMANINYYYFKADNYESNSKEVDHSDIENSQLHTVLGYKLNENHLFKIYFDKMDKLYAIPNKTPQRTDIDMTQDRFGFLWHIKDIKYFNSITTEYQNSKYKHYERENGRYDGLFKQNQQSISSKFNIIDNENSFDIRISFLENSLQVCHEHGGCKELSSALRTNIEDGASLMQYYNSLNIPYSHGHPMPDSKEKQFSFGTFWSHTNEKREYSLSLNTIFRSISVDSKNIQETWLVPSTLYKDYYNTQEKGALSLSLGWWEEWTKKFSSQFYLAYMQRLPSSQELFWNGFHHATESYILGNYKLKKEQSFQLNMEFLYSHSNFLSKFHTFYYYFPNYIYQTPLILNGVQALDPFHLSSVWQMKGNRASIYGFSFEEQYKYNISSHNLKASMQLNFLKGELINNGYIPRMPPLNTTLSLEDKYKNTTTTIEYKWVDKSRYLAKNETPTDFYFMLNLYFDYKLKNKSLWIKGENLTNEVATNHISFLKETTPLTGRNFTLGVSYTF